MNDEAKKPKHLNIAKWQWLLGCGTDALPSFRITAERVTIKRVALRPDLSEEHDHER